MKYLIILALVFLLYYYYQPQEQTLSPQNEQPEQSISAGRKQWETRSDDQPPVAIKVTPTELGRDAKQWRFNIVFDTHSGSLDDDPLAIATLIDDKNNIYQPNNWEGAGPGGHHREGVLIFEAINPAPAYVELKIKNVGGIAERLFKWKMQ
ncbi:MAG: hypothetical protein Q8N65_01205 [bacterium]|nr:hypothetical protein [bacterium]